MRFARYFYRFGTHHHRAFNSKRVLGTAGGVGGGTALLSMSLFGSAKKEEPKQLGPDFDMIKREADLLYNAYLIDNVYNLLKRHTSSEDPEILWRLARVIYEQGKQQPKASEERKRLFQQALDYADKALKCAPPSGSFGAHKWYAICLNSVTEEKGSKEQLASAMDVKTHFERALEVNSLDATTWHLLGVWHYTFADLPTYLRWGAAAFYSKPPQSSYDEALRHFERAEAISPNFYSANNYYLGLTYEKLNRRQEAMEQFKKAFLAPVITVDDKDIHQKALERLKSYKIGEKELVELMREQK